MAFPSPDQKKIIDAPKSNILVSAAAGSGKTAVMVERIVQRIIAGELSLTRALIITFTNAAAASMEEKIRKALQDALKKLPEDDPRAARLRYEILHLPRAHIQTIHAFCLWLIRSFPQDVVDEEGQSLLEADFQIMDDSLSQTYLDEAIAQVFTTQYELAEKGENPEFLVLLDNYASAKTDKGLRELLKSLFFYLRSLPDYRSYVENLLENLEDACQNFGKSLSIAYLYQELKLRVDYALAGEDNLKHELDTRTWNFFSKEESDLALDEELRSIMNMASSMGLILQAYERGEIAGEELWDKLYEAKAIAKVRGRKPSLRNEMAKSYFEDFQKAYADILYASDLITESQAKGFTAFDTTPILTMPLEEIEKGLVVSYPYIEKLFRILLDIDLAYQALKRDRKKIDFADYEHFALTILKGRDGAAFCREQFREIYVDEYQDTSSIQNAILDQIGQDNVFMVGDVKQSIYRFRHARPETFLEKEKIFLNTPGPDEVFYLQENFRSQAGILLGSNEVFQRLMTRDFTGIEYLPKQKLRPGLEDTAKSERIEIWPYVKSETADLAAALAKEDETERSYIELEQALTRKWGGLTARKWLKAGPRERNLMRICQKIKQLHEEDRVPYDDIAIMARGNTTCDLASEILQGAGIPQNRKQTRSVQDTYLLQVQLSLLQVLDNASQDIPLASLLLSGLFEESLDEAELLEIRLWQKEHRNKDGLYRGLLAYSEEVEGPLALKVKRILLDLAYWRDREKQMAPRALLEEIYFENNYKAKILQSEGREGLDILEDFLSEVENLYAGGRSNLFELVQYFEEEIALDRNMKNENDPTGEGVHILTYHASKGLEYGHVFLLDLHSKLQDKDKSRDVMISENLGIGFNNLDPEGNYTYKSHLILAMQTDRQRRYLTEEICIFYVAMTRAKNKLYLCMEIDEEARLSPKQKFLMEKAGQSPTIGLDSALLQSIGSYEDMILLALASNKSPAVQAGLKAMYPEDEWEIKSNLESYYDLTEPSIWTFKPALDMGSYKAILEHYDRPIEEETTAKTISSDREEDLLLAKGSVGFIEGPLDQYYEAKIQAASLPKQSVSEIKRMSQQEAVLDEEDYTINLTKQSPDLNLKSGKLTASELGTLLHKAMQFIRLKPEADASYVKDQLDDLMDKDFISPEERQYLESYEDKILAYLKSDLAYEILEAQAKGQVYRELPFTVRYEPPTGPVLVQGIIDLWYLLGDKLALLDYKSDRIHSSKAEAVFLERYRVQLMLYATALEKALHRPVDAITIWSIHNERAYSYRREEIFTI